MPELKTRRSGQALAEYVVIVALVAVTLVGALLLFREAIADQLGSPVSEEVECASPGHGGLNPGREDGTPKGLCE